MTGSFAENVKGFILKPAETFRSTQGESLNSAYQYYVRLVVIYSVILFAFIAASIAATGSRHPAGTLPGGGIRLMQAFGPFLETYILWLPVFLFILLLFIVFIQGFEIHVFVLLFGGQKGLVQTLKTIMYAFTPVMFLGWIPIISIVGGVWTYILIVIGIRENQEMSTGRAVLVALIPPVLSLIFFAGVITLIGPFLRALAALNG